MSSALIPVSISSPSGIIPGFERPRTVKRELYEQVEDALEKQLPCFPINQFIVNDIVLHKFPSLPKVIDVNSCLALVKYVPAAKSTPITQKVDSWIQKYFQGKEKLIIYGERIDKDIEKLCLERLGVTQTLIPEQFSQEELAVFDLSPLELRLIQKSTPEVNPRQIACHQFALLKIKEKGSLEFLFEEGVKDDKLPQFLLRWGYKPVQSPMPNDLVLYFQDGILKYTGVYLGNDIVESKPGNKQPVCLRHSLSVVSKQDGNQIAFYRKFEEGSRKSFKEITDKLFFSLGLPNLAFEVGLRAIQLP